MLTVRTGAVVTMHADRVQSHESFCLIGNRIAHVTYKDTGVIIAPYFTGDVFNVIDLVRPRSLAGAWPVPRC